MKKLLIGLLAIILIAGCTQQTTYTAEDLSDLPDVNVTGMPSLGELPDTEVDVNLSAGLITENPFPSQPSIE